MNLKAKRYEESHRQKAQAELAARMALLKERGVAPKIIEKDTIVRKLKAEMRKAKHRLVGVASQEQLLARKVQDKQAKAAAEIEKKAGPKAEPVKKEAAKPAKKEKKPKEKKPAAAG